MDIYSNGISAIEEKSKYNIKIQGRGDRLLCNRRLALGDIGSVVKGLPSKVNLPHEWTLVNENSEFAEEEKDYLGKKLDLYFSDADISSRQDVRQVSGNGKRIVYLSPMYKSRDGHSYLFYVGISTTHFFLVRYLSLEKKYELVYDGVI